MWYQEYTLKVLSDLVIPLTKEPLVCTTQETVYAPGLI